MSTVKQKILIVDDEPDILELIAYNLNKEGYLYITASNGLEAIQMAKKHLPDLILLDIMMPKLDGIETGATADQTSAQILTSIKTVDGASSGLDADLLDGQHLSLIHI